MAKDLFGSTQDLSLVLEVLAFIWTQDKMLFTWKNAFWKSLWKLHYGGSWFSLEDKRGLSLGDLIRPFCPKLEFIIKPKRGLGGGWWTQRHSIEISKKMDFHHYVNKEITFVRSNDIVMYARGEHPRITLVERCNEAMGWVAWPMLEWQF